MEKMNVWFKLAQVQQNLKAPKGQYNTFGRYRFRSCEDILEAVKPHLKEVGAVIILTDDVELIGTRFYVRATAKFIDCESTDTITVCASAREDETKKGMDGSQITGAASSYARKYALNGLLDIDDTKDADTNEQREANAQAQKQPTTPDKPTVAQKPAQKQKQPVNAQKQPEQATQPEPPIPEPPTQPEEEMTFCCDVCGKPFEPFTTKDSQTYTPAVQYALCRGKSPDGVVRCIDCRNKMLAEQKQ